MRIFQALGLVILLTACSTGGTPELNQALRDAPPSMQVTLAQMAAFPLREQYLSICPADLRGPVEPPIGISRADCEANPRACIDLCYSDDADACFYIANYIQSDDRMRDFPDGEYAVPFYQRACHLGDANACVNVAATAANGDWVNGAPEALTNANCQYRTYREACDAGAYWGCRMVAREYRNPNRTGGLRQDLAEQADARADALR